MSNSSSYHVCRLDNLYHWMHGPPRNLVASHRIARRFFADVPSTVTADAWASACEASFQFMSRTSGDVAKPLRTILEMAELPSSVVDFVTNPSRVFEMVCQWDQMQASIHSLRWNASSHSYYISRAGLQKMRIETSSMAFVRDPRTQRHNEIVYVSDLAVVPPPIQRLLNETFRSIKMLIDVWRVCVALQKPSLPPVSFDWVVERYRKERKIDDTLSEYRTYVCHSIAAKMNAFMFVNNTDDSATTSKMLAMRIGSTWVMRAWDEVHRYAYEWLVVYCSTK